MTVATPTRRNMLGSHSSREHDGRQKRTPTAPESLVSLELAVGSILPCIEGGLTGIVPSLAVRFLDFPMLRLDIVSPQAVRELRDALSTEGMPRDMAWGTAAVTVQRLQGKDGEFVMNKGKSCLFRTSVSSLQQRLQDTPLYVSAGPLALSTAALLAMPIVLSGSPLFAVRVVTCVLERLFVPAMGQPLPRHDLHYTAARSLICRAASCHSLSLICRAAPCHSLSFHIPWHPPIHSPLPSP